MGYEINIAFAIVQLPEIFSGVSQFCNERSIEGEPSQLVMVLPMGARQKLAGMAMVASGPQRCGTADFSG